MLSRDRSFSYEVGGGGLVGLGGEHAKNGFRRGGRAIPPPPKKK